MSRRQPLRAKHPRSLAPAFPSFLSVTAPRGLDHLNFKPRCELLEVRAMMSVAPLYYSATGAGNNLSNPNWGAAGQDLLRSLLSSNYVNGVSSMAGQIDPATGKVNTTLPSARAISNTVGNQVTEDLDSRDLSAFIYAWGQFVDHDLDLTPDGGTSVPMAVPKGDPQFDPSSAGGQTLPFTRSVTDPATGTSTTNPLNQVTVVTSFLDGSMIYGSDSTRAAALRSFQGGKLLTSAGNLLPLNTAGLANANDGPYPSTDMFLAGDIRSNENIELTSLQTLFMREHNRQATILAAQHPTWTDEQLYQGARQIVIAEIQSITYNQYLPSLLGSGAITAYTGYKPTVNPGITPEFSEAAFRFGHTQLDEDVEFLKNDGSNLPFSYTLPDGTKVDINTPADIASDETGMSLVEAFFNPYVLQQQPGALGSILKYLGSDNAQTVDLQMVDAVRNVLFGAPGSGAGGEDLFALDIQRGRDVGLQSYNTTRVAYGLPAVTSFSQISSDPAVQAELKSLYGTVDKVDLFVGGLAEDHVKGSSVGPTFQAIIANQFERTRDGDRLWYQNIFSGADLKAIQNTTLADIIRLNSTATNLQSNVFVFDAAVSGHVFLDVNGNGRQNILEPPLGGILVQLVDANGAIAASTRTARDGSYTFDHLELGKYSVQIGGLRSALVTLPSPVQVKVDTGGTVTADLGLKINLPGRPGSPANLLSQLLSALGAWLQQAANQSHAATPNSAPARPH